MPYIALSPTEIDAKSPMDDSLWLKVKDNFDDLNSRVIASGSKTYLYELQGRLSMMRQFKRSICSGVQNFSFQPSAAKYLLKQSGTSGTLSFDIRRTTSPNTPIIGIDHQYTAATSAIAQQGSAITTQSIARSTTQILTQSISLAKSSVAIQSIINVGGNFWRYNLASSFDADTVVGDSIVVASATSGANNGTFVIIEKDQSGGSNFVVSNASGVAQTSAAGTAQPTIISYNFTNPVNSEFASGDIVNLAGHTAGANNSNAIPIFKINQAGNNIWIKNPTGVVQAAPAGTADCNRWRFSYLSAVNTTDYVVGERAKMSGHTAGGNNGNFVITSVNNGGNNIIVFNAAGVVQGGVAGQALPNRWRYNLPSDPTASGNVAVNDTMYMLGHTNAANDGVFVIRDITSSAVIVYNESGVAQASTPGNVFTTRKIVKFSTDQSAVFSTSSFVELRGCPSGFYNFSNFRSPFKVLQVNRGGGSNFNIVIDSPLAPSQASPAGHVHLEMKSIFTVIPSLSASLTALAANQNLVGASTSFVTATIPADTPLLLYVLTMMGGDPRDLTVTLT
jgi:hypothetical protein